jgi:hypothetical protein
VRRGRGGTGAAFLAALGLCSSIVLAACTDNPSAARVPRTLTSFPRSPLASSVQSPGGSWAVLPMGDPRQSLNTFWQLLYQGSSSSTWTNDVEVTAVATNGGLSLAAAGGRILVGVRPSNLLTFSPLVSTDDSGASWSNGLLTDGLAARTDVLALTTSGEALALVGAPNATEVLASTGGFSNWHVVATKAGLEALSTRSCAPLTLSAVGYLGSAPVIGANCSVRGMAGIFLSGPSGLALSAPHLGRTLRRAPVEVLGLMSTPTDLDALLGLAEGSVAEILAASTTDGSRWAVSDPLPLGSTRLESFGPDGSGGMFAVLQGSTGIEQAFVTDGQTAAWHRLPPPPPGTATLAFYGARTEALAVADTVLTVWTLQPTSRSWRKGQVMFVPIQFGSSS